MYILKPSFYDQFRCLADKCSYTCCRDWEITIDPDTYIKNEEIYRQYISKERGQEARRIRLDEEGICPFLDEKGLCKLVTGHGQTVLSHTCETFPRFTLKRPEITEQALSNACPAVLQFLKTLPVPLSFVMEETDNIGAWGAVNEREEIVQCRDQVIDLLQIHALPLWSRLFMIYQFAKKTDSDLGKNLDHCIQQYNSVPYLMELYQSLAKLECDYLYKLGSISELFMQINRSFQNYLGYQIYIGRLMQYAGGLQAEGLEPVWREFEEVFEQNEDFFENFSVNYIFKNALTGSEGEDFYKSILALLLEIAMIKFTIFLQWMYNKKKITDEEIIGICCYYARVIEHNAGKMYCFIDEIQKDGWFEPGRIFILIR